MATRLNKTDLANPIAVPAGNIEEYLGSVEMLEKNYIITLLGAFSFTYAPGVWASPRIAITSHKVNQIV